MDNKVQVVIENRDAKGVYSNLMEIKGKKEEFCLDFYNVFPPVGALTARVIISPGHLKRMLNALQDSLKKHEEAFGEVKEAQEPPKPNIGYKAD